MTLRTLHLTADVGRRSMRATARAVAARSPRTEARVAAALSLLVAGGALAEQGVFAVALQAGQTVTVSPNAGADRAVPVLATLEYGFAERWSLGSTSGVELGPSGTTVLTALDVRLTVLRTHWWTLQTLLAPEVRWLPVSGRAELGARAAFAVRYQLMWGVGLAAELGVRGRAEATGPFVPSLQGFLVAGLFIEA